MAGEVGRRCRRPVGPASLANKWQDPRGIYLPSAPTRTSVRPSRGCVRERRAHGATSGSRQLPPTPGLSARHLDGRKVRVDYALSSVGAACKARRLSLTLASRSGPNTDTRVYDISSNRGTKEVDVPLRRWCARPVPASSRRRPDISLRARLATRSAHRVTGSDVPSSLEVRAARLEGTAQYRGAGCRSWLVEGGSDDQIGARTSRLSDD